MKHQTPLTHHKSQRGQSIIELALTFPILLLILSGILDLGRIYYTHIALEDAAGEAALYLALNPQCANEAEGEPCQNPNNATFRARNAGSQEVNWDRVNIIVDRPPVFGVGDTVAITVEYPFQPITPIISSIASTITLRSTATHLIVNETYVVF